MTFREMKRKTVEATNSLSKSSWIKNGNKTISSHLKDFIFFVHRVFSFLV